VVRSSNFGGFAVDGVLLFSVQLAEPIDGFSHHVEQSPFNLITDGYAEGTPQQFHGHPAAETVSTVHSDRPHYVLAEVLLYL